MVLFVKYKIKTSPGIFFTTALISNVYFSFINVLIFSTKLNDPFLSLLKILMLSYHGILSLEQYITLGVSAICDF